MSAELGYLHKGQTAHAQRANCSCTEGRQLVDKGHTACVQRADMLMYRGQTAVVQRADCSCTEGRLLMYTEMLCEEYCRCK